MNSVSIFWHKHGFKFMLILFVSLTSVIVIVKRMSGFKKKKTKSFQYYFKNLEEKYPQAFKHKKLPNVWNGESKGEIQCRSFLERKYKCAFPKVRPSFLRNPVTNGALLELDCFNEKLKLACEYQGEQHFKFVSHFHKSNDSFLNQKYRDELKRNLCKENGVYLIEVPFYVSDIDSFLEKETEIWNQSVNIHVKRQQHLL
jgi:hypothetical protein